MSETKNAPPRVGRWYRVGQRFATLEERVAALEARDRSMSTTPTILNIPGGFITRRDVYGDAKPSLAPPAVAGPTWEETVRDAARVIADEIQGRPIACNIDHDACSAEQRSGTGRAAQGPCVRGVVDLVAASADDQHAAERGTPAAGAEVTASDGGDTARADSAVAELREAASMLAEADRRERQAAALDPYDSVRRACLGYEAKRLRREAGERIASWRERAAVGERRKWAAAIASALDGADRSGCESFVSREEMASRVAAMRAELERERKLRREAEEAFKTANGMRNEEARRRGLTVGARVRGARSGVAFGVIAGFNKSGDPYVFDRDGGYGHADGRAYIAEDLELDTEATT